MVNKRSDTNQWQADFRYQGKRYRRSFDDRTKAEAWEAAAKVRLGQGLPADEDQSPAKDGAWTLQTLFDATKARHWVGTANEVNSVRNGEEIIGILGADKDPNDIKATDVDEAVKQLLKKGNSAATVNRKLAALSKMYSHGLVRGIIKVKPHLDRQKESEGRIRWYTPDEERRVIQVLRDWGEPDYAEYCTFLVDIGCRAGEGSRILWRDIDDIYVRFHRTKNGKARAVPMTQRVREMLKRRRPTEKYEPESRVWGDLDSKVVSRAWTSARKEAGITDEEACLHALRHTCASRLVQAGVQIMVVQQWLGHKTLAMTLRYAHLAPINLLEAVKILDGFSTAEQLLKTG